LALKIELSRYIGERECPSCHGARLKKESLSVRIGGMNIYDLCRLSVGEAEVFFRELELAPQERLISERIRKEITDRLKFLLDVGMDYLSLERSAGSLSGEKVNVSGWQHKSALASWGYFTSWTSPRSDYIPAIRNDSLGPSKGCETSVIR